MSNENKLLESKKSKKTFAVKSGNKGEEEGHKETMCGHQQYWRGQKTKCQNSGINQNNPMRKLSRLYAHDRHFKQISCTEVALFLNRLQLV